MAQQCSLAHELSALDQDDDDDAAAANATRMHATIASTTIGASRVNSTTEHPSHSPTSHQSHNNNNTPLAKYLTKLRNGGDAHKDDDEEEVVRDEDGMAAESQKTQELNQEEAEEEDRSSATENIPNAATSSSSSSTLRTLLLLLLEFISPLLVSFVFTDATLAHRARRWNVEVCQCEMQRQRQHHLHTISTATVSREYIQKQMRYLASVYRVMMIFSMIQIIVAFVCILLQTCSTASSTFMLQLLFTAKDDDSSVIHSSTSSSSSTSPSSIPLLLAYILLLLHSLNNLLLTLHHHRSSLHSHSLSYSFLTYFYLSNRSESESKKLIILMIEMELVKRGYYLTSSSISSSSSSKHHHDHIAVPIVIQKIDRIGRGGTNHHSMNMRQDESRHTQLRIELKSMMDEEIRIMKQMMEQIQIKQLMSDAGLSGASLPSTASSSSASSSFSAFSSSTSLPSIVELKSLRIQCLNQRSRMLQATMRLLDTVTCDEGAVVSILSMLASFFTSYHSDASHSSSIQNSTIESYLSHAYIRMNIMLTHHHERLRDFLPEDSSSYTSSTAASSSAVSSASLPSHRVSLESSLTNLRDSIRSIERRIQLAMERGTKMKRSSVSGDEADMMTKEDLNSASAFSELVSALSFSPLPSLADSSPSASSSSSSSSSSHLLLPWSSSISTSLLSDLRYFRTQSHQLQIQCDRIEMMIRKCEKEEGVERNDEGDDESENGIVQESSVVNESESSASSSVDSSVTPADLFAAMCAMRKRTPEGMGSLFEGDGQFEEREFQPRRSVKPSSSSSSSSTAVTTPAVSIFTILAELKSVLQQRKPTYEYVSLAQEDAIPAAESKE